MGFYVAAQVGLGNTFVESVPVPAGTRPSDLLVMMALSSWRKPLPKPFITEPLELKCTDPRFTQAAAWLGYGDDGVTSQRAWGVWVGHAEDGDPPFLFEFGPHDTQQFSQFVGVEMLALRAEDGGGLDVDLDRLAFAFSPPSEANTDLIGIPALPGAGISAVAIAALYRNAPGVFSDYVDTSAPDPPWRIVHASNNNYMGHTVYGIDEAHPAATETIKLDGTVGAYVLAFGVRPSAVVTRLHPRDDGLGMSSAARKYPPVRGPLGGRIVGRHQ